MTANEFKTQSNRIRPQLLSLAFRYMKNEMAAEDAVQDVLLRLWQLHESLKSPLDAFALTLIKNRCIDVLRKQNHNTDIAPETVMVAESTESTDEAMRLLLQLIDQLPSLQQSIMRLRHVEGMSMKEIAAITGSTEAAIRQTLSRARKLIKTQFKQAYND